MNKKTALPLLAATLILSILPATYAAAAKAHDERIWQAVPEGAGNPAGKRSIVPEAYRTFRLDQAALAKLLASAPMEFTRNASQNPIIPLPMPDGTLARFRFEESPVMVPSFAAKHPEIKTYRAQGIDDPAATVRFDWLPSGFHGLILSTAGTVLIHPYAAGNTTDYITFWKKDAAMSKHPFVCSTDDSELRALVPPEFAPAVSSGSTLRTYDVAIACTNEFAVALGDNDTSKTIAAEVEIMNQVNAIFERDVTIHINMVDNEDITYAGDNESCGGPCDDTNDPFTNTSAMTGEMATVLRSVIGASNYDFGHGFFYGGGGSSGGFVCNSDNKEAASSGVGSTEDHYLVVHEMGHQFTASHTFNANGTGANSCDQNRVHESAYEPGSGATIEAYNGGTCGNQSLVPSLYTDTFHVKSIEQIIAYTQSGGGSSCAATTSTGRSAPSAGGPGDFTIPKQTPFYLTASAIGSGMTFDWQEYDLDAGGVGTNAVPNTDSGGTARPILRGYSPSSSGTRIFPSLQYILNNANVPPSTTTVGPYTFLTGELLPAISRTMVFKVVVRDNHSGAGGINTAQSSITIDGTATPFAVTYPNSAVNVSQGTNLTVTWVASGNASNVKISLSTDGGYTFPTVLASSTANDGSHTVVVPNSPSSLARIKVEAVGNIYFDICDTNFTIFGIGGGGSGDGD